MPRSRFPARSVLLDACALIRLYKCDALDLLVGTVRFVVAEHAHGEFAASGPSARAALRRLRVEPRSIIPGTPEWDHFARVRVEFSTVDLGEDQSIAIALAEADLGNPMPIVTYDGGAAKKARGLGVATISFPETLAWMRSCGLLTEEQAAEIEARAAARDGWRPPAQVVLPATLIAQLHEALAPSRKPVKPKPRKRR